MKIVKNSPPVYCYRHGAFLEDCDLTGMGAECMWYYDNE